MSLRHCGIVCEDLSKMIEFYKLLGFEKYIDNEIKGSFISELLGVFNANVKIVKLKSIKDGSIIELIKYKYKNNLRDKQELYEQGLSHIAITVNNLDEIFETLTLQSINFITPPLLSKKDNVKVCFCRDAEGNWIELVEDL
jgi:catechol 2,3-dioxygenase-like lactoylglutathione lyase family enzyme